MPSRSQICRVFAIFIAAICVASVWAATSSAQRVSPQSGEGIYGLLQRNGITPTSASVAEFRSLNTGRLLSDGGLKKGTSYILPSSSIRHFELFGGEYAAIKQESSSLKGVAYFLISGHGGRDPGAVGTRNGKPLHEDEYAYDVMLRVARGLMAHGAEVFVMVQDDPIRDEKYLEPDQDEKNIDGTPVSRDRRVKERVEMVNILARKSSARVKRVVEIHVDARDQSSTQVDVHFYYNSPAGRKLSTILRDTMRDQYKLAQPNRGYYGKVSKADLYTLKYTNPVATYVELGNIHHERDQRRIIEPGNRQAIANWMVLGFIKEAGTSTTRS